MNNNKSNKLAYTIICILGVAVIVTVIALFVMTCKENTHDVVDGIINNSTSILK